MQDFSSRWLLVASLPTLAMFIHLIFDILMTPKVQCKLVNLYCNKLDSYALHQASRNSGSNVIMNLHNNEMVAANSIALPNHRILHFRRNLAHAFKV